LTTVPTVVIDNPILNSPFKEPTRHFRFDDDGIKDEIVQGRRVSSYFVPVPQSKKKGGKGSKQLALDTEWTRDRIEENVLVNRIRGRVSIWRQGGYLGVTPTTARLLDYWNNQDRFRRLFFCQIEALETAIYITECARKFGDAWIENELREANDLSNPGLPRMALKMATGSGKTVVMAMLIAWQTLNKLANQQDARFTDAFLIITPGITIRDRLRVLKPNDPESYYQQLDVVPPSDRERLQQAKIVITNYHAFLPREKQQISKTGRAVLGIGEKSPFTETPGEVVRRVCRELGNKKNIIVLNDEAHHCYRRKPEAEEEKLVGDERKEAEKREEEARVWISGVEAVKEKIGVRAIFDLSATPFFLRGSGYSEGTLFPWVVSDFSLIDAIESGIVKVPRVPVSDDSMVNDLPTYRELWPSIRDELPKKGRKTDALSGEPTLPGPLHGALHSLYRDYERAYKRWQDQGEEAHLGGVMPPVFIVVCNNTNVSKLVFDYISGWERQVEGQDTPWVQAGKLELFRNDNGERGWRDRPNTILVDSEQFESGGAMSAEFKAIAAREIDEFREEYARRFPGRDASELTDEDLLREVMNTVGKRGKLGEHVRCVVSVSMLTEGWDANTVTHILGVRAFGTQLLCEQVVGRALRRMSYAANDDDVFEAEYAEVYGVPFSFIPSNGGTGTTTPPKLATRVRAMADREERCEITFPRLVGYRYELPDAPLRAEFTAESHLAIDTRMQPSWTEVTGVTGVSERRETYDATTRRNAVAFQLAVDTLGWLRDEDQQVKPWLFPQLLEITKTWMDRYVSLKDGVTVAYLLADPWRGHAASKIFRAIVTSDPGEERLKPILRTYDAIGSTRYVDFDTTKPVFVTDPWKCHISHVVADTGSWEQKMAQNLEEMDEVVRYVKNANLGFTIPYTIDGQEKAYFPDFIACVDDGHGKDDLLNLIVEVSGENRRDKREKIETAKSLWVPAVNNAGRFGRWAFFNSDDPWSAMKLIRDHVAALRSVAANVS
jgi:type III restriction enzyme